MKENNWVEKISAILNEIEEEKKSISVDKNEKVLVANKPQIFGLYSLLMERVRKCEEVKGEVISFPKVFVKICSSFQITKSEAWELLFLMRDFDKIEIIAGRGIKIKNG